MGPRPIKAPFEVLFLMRPREAARGGKRWVQIHARRGLEKLKQKAATTERDRLVRGER